MLEETIVVVVALLAICGFHVNADTSSMTESIPQETPRAGVERFDLSDSEYNKLRRAAEDGDVEAAFRLAMYFDFVKLDSAQSLQWLERSAALGHVESQTFLGAKLLQGGDVSSRERGMYWLERAAQAGDWHARYLLDLERGRKGP